jgi:uncharacterized protein YcbK (DUF882 family)
MGWLGRSSAVLSILLLGAVSVVPAAAAAKPKTKSAAKHKPKIAPRDTRRGATWKPKAKKGGAYSKHVKGWHDKEDGATSPKDAAGRPKLVLEAINVKETVELVASSDKGEFPEAERQKAARILRDTRHDKETDIDPRLLDLLYDIQRHFDAPSIRVISAYREPKGKSGSRHAQGQAADIVVPGAKDHQVFSYVQAMHGTGAGLYPVSGFVHVDVREASTSWVDNSGPGKASRVKNKRRAKRAPAKHKPAAKKKK